MGIVPLYKPLKEIFTTGKSFYAKNGTHYLLLFYKSISFSFLNFVLEGDIPGDIYIVQVTANK